MRKIPLILLLALISGLVVTIGLVKPQDTSAGSLPCFLCHGFQMQGSDLAPSVADTKLDDQQILDQIRNPRGIMPALPEFAQQPIVDMIRSFPTGQATASISDGDRSVALATLAAVAIARSTEFARLTQLPPVDEIESTPSPTPVDMAPVNKPAAASSIETAATIWFNLVGGMVVLGAGAGLAWIVRRKGS